MSLLNQKMAQPYRRREMDEIREGEIPLDIDPATMPADGHVVFIGRVRSPWLSRQTCPKNMRAARETGQAAELDPSRGARAGRGGGCRGSLFSWLVRWARKFILQNPRHAAEPSGTFALRSPARPNPIGLHVVRLVSLDHAGGRLRLEAVDLIDGTPILDIKPYFASADAVSDATIAERGTP